MYHFLSSFLSAFHLSLLFLAFIRGSHTVARTSVEVVPGKALHYDWKKQGFEIHIPAEALQSSSAPLTMHIQASVSGKFQLPNDLELVSAVYWISFPKKFSQPVRVTVQHCACLGYPDTLTSLSFITAKCTQPTLPYNFKLLPNGAFSSDSKYGCIELNHFSAVAVAGINREYVILTHYVPQRTATTWLTHFAITSNLNINLLVRAINYDQSQPMMCHNRVSKPICHKPITVMYIILL